MQDCFFQYCSGSKTLDFTSITNHIHNWVGVVFALTPSLHSFWNYFSTLLQWHIGHLLTWGVHHSVSCLFAFSYCSWQEYWSDLPFPSPASHVLSELSTMTCLFWVALHGMAHSFIELDKAVVHVISLVSFCDCGFHSVSPLMNKDQRSFLMGETDWGRNWILFWWAEPCSVNL